MNRLTKNLNTPHDDTTYADVVKDCIDRENIVLTKLKHFEDIEDELGCDLINLFKALKQGYIYVKLEDGIIKREVDMLDFKEGVRCVLFDKSCQVDNNLQCYGMLNYIQDYGKAWSLTKEELEVE